MRAANIPESMIGNAETIVIGHPDTNENDVHALITHGLEGEKRFSIRCELEEGDLHDLSNGGAVWVTFFSEEVPEFMIFTQR